jgi:hypothetical protein
MILSLSCLFKIYIIKFRHKNHYYGNNYHEARELAKYICDHSKKDDFHGPSGPKKLFENEGEKNNIKSFQEPFEGVRT